MNNSSTATHVQLETARELLKSRVSGREDTENIRLENGAGRIVAETLIAPRNVPHYARAAMDGYAVRSEDTAEASEQSPVRLTETDADVESGTAHYVDTGCEIPPGADTVVRLERVERRDDELRVPQPVREGKDVAPVGEDVTKGTTLYEPGHRLTPADLGVLRSVGIEEIPVFERPTVAVIPTGEELVSAEPDPGEVVETNGLMISQYVDRWGGEPLARDIVTDDVAKLRAAIRRDQSQDVIVMSGGSSAGKRDLLPEVVSELGELYVHHLDIKPGHPVGLGSVDGTPIFLLPGYPVSAMLNAVQLLRPALAWLQGWSPPPFPTTSAELAESISSESGVRRFERVQIENNDDRVSARPVAKRGAGALTSVTTADGWVVLDEETTSIPTGEQVTVEHWDRGR